MDFILQNTVIKSVNTDETPTSSILKNYVMFECFESLRFPNTKGIKAVEGGRMRMTIKWMLTRQHRSRSVDKRTVFILWFSNHAKKKMTHLNQERCWGFGDGFLGAWGANIGEKALVLPPGGATDDFITDCKICWLHDTLRCYCHLTLPG